MSSGSSWTPLAVLTLLARLAVGGWFIYLGTLKLMAPPADFLKIINEFEVLPTQPPILINSVAVFLPVLEVIAGACLVLGVFLRGSALAILVSMLGFMPALIFRAMGIQEAEGLSFCQVAFDCGCGTGEVNICKKLTENSALIFGAALALFSKWHVLTLTKLPGADAE
ncbi:MAG: DoxX family protein [Planctomycetota bacterium]